VDGLDIQLIMAKIVFSVSEDLACCFYLCEWRVYITGYDGGIVDKVQETTSVLG
jgi:ferritin-like protein